VLTDRPHVAEQQRNAGELRPALWSAKERAPPVRARYRSRPDPQPADGQRARVRPQPEKLLVRKDPPCGTQQHGRPRAHV